MTSIGVTGTRKTPEQVRDEWVAVGVRDGTRMRELETIGFDRRTAREERELSFRRNAFWRYFDCKDSNGGAWMDGFYSVYGLTVTMATS